MMTYNIAILRGWKIDSFCNVLGTFLELFNFFVAFLIACSLKYPPFAWTNKENVEEEGKRSKRQWLANFYE